MTDKNIETVKAMYAAFGRGDLQFVLDQLADADFQGWQVNSATRTRVPWHMELTNKQAVARYFTEGLRGIDHTKFEPRDFASNGRQVYVTVDMTQKVAASGKTIEQKDVVHTFTFADGRIVKVRIAEDTALTAAAF